MERHSLVSVNRKTTFRTVRGVIETSEDEMRSALAWKKYGASFPEGAVNLLRTQAGPPQNTWGGRRLLHLWMAKPWKWRVKTDPPVASSLATVVIDGGLWWLSDGATEAATNEGFVQRERDHTGLDGRLVVMVFPDALAHGVSAMPRAQTTWLGRKTMGVRTTSSETELPYWPGADELRMDIDVEFGVILRWTAFHEGSAYWSAAFVEIDFNATFSPDLFRFTPEPGMRIRRFDGANNALTE